MAKKSTKSLKEHAMEGEIKLLRSTIAILTERLKAETELRQAAERGPGIVEFARNEYAGSKGEWRQVNRTPDPVNHPAHYTKHPSGVECIDVSEHFTANLAQTIQYIWRADLKGSALEDLRKGAWFLAREISKREKEAIK